jgi:hypothetical protein
MQFPKQILDWMKVYSRNPVSNLHEKFDFSHIAVAGHSHGGSLAAYAYANGGFLPGPPAQISGCSCFWRNQTVPWRVGLWVQGGAVGWHVNLLWARKPFTLGPSGRGGGPKGTLLKVGRFGIFESAVKVRSAAVVGEGGGWSNETVYKSGRWKVGGGQRGWPWKIMAILPPQLRIAFSFSYFSAQLKGNDLFLRETFLDSIQRSSSRLIWMFRTSHALLLHILFLGCLMRRKRQPYHTIPYHAMPPSGGTTCR